MSNNTQLNSTQDVFDYKKMTKFVVDMKDLKQDAEGNFIRDSYTRSGFINGEWLKVPDAYYYDVEFKKFITENFNENPDIIEDDGKTHYYLLKQNTSEIVSNSHLQNLQLNDTEESYDEGAGFIA